MCSSSSESSDDSHHEKSRKRRKHRHPNQDRRSSKKESSSKNKSYRDKREGRDVHKFSRNVRRENNDVHYDRSQGERDRLYRDSRHDHLRREEDRQYDRRRYERSPPRREESRPRYRDYEEKTRRQRGPIEYNKKHDNVNKETMSRRNNLEEVKVRNEPSPEWGKPTVKAEAKPKLEEKDKPNFELSGKLTEDTNTVNGVVIKYAEPSDARKPKRRWRLYPFKGEKALPTLYIHRQSAYLMGRDRKVADIPLDHPSCSKQHAVLQYRLVSFQKEGGGEGRRIRPYLIDLESANGTFVNNIKLEPRRYHELLKRDVIRFGFSSREYVLLHEHSKDDSFDDDVPSTTTSIPTLTTTA